MSYRNQALPFQFEEIQSWWSSVSPKWPFWIWNPNLQPQLVWFRSFDWACTSIHISNNRGPIDAKAEVKGGEQRTELVRVAVSYCVSFTMWAWSVSEGEKTPRLPQIANRLWLLLPQRVQVMSVCFWQTPFSSSYCDKSSTIWFGSGVAVATMQVDCGGILGVFMGYFIFLSLWKVSFSTKWFILSEPLIQQVKGCIDLIKKLIC